MFRALGNFFPCRYIYVGPYSTFLFSFTQCNTSKSCKCQLPDCTCRPLPPRTITRYHYGKCILSLICWKSPTSRRPDPLVGRGWFWTGLPYPSLPQIISLHARCCDAVRHWPIGPRSLQAVGSYDGPPGCQARGAPVSLQPLIGPARFPPNGQARLRCDPRPSGPSLQEQRVRSVSDEESRLCYNRNVLSTLPATQGPVSPLLFLAGCFQPPGKPDTWGTTCLIEASQGYAPALQKGTLVAGRAGSLLHAAWDMEN